VSREAIHKKFNKNAVEFMKSIFGQLLEKRFNTDNSRPQNLAHFNRICIKDSSKFRLPDNLSKDYPGYGGSYNCQGLMNLQYEYDFISGNWETLEFTKATRNDQTDSKETLSEIKRKDLLIRDLGYITPIYLKEIEKKRAYYLNRLPIAYSMFMDNENRTAFNWVKTHKKLTNNKIDVLEFDVLLSKKHKIKARMIITKVPKEVYDQRIRKASKQAKSKKCQLSKEYKTKAWFNIFITNVPCDIFSSEDIVKMYSLRWQIELVFKTWKSILRINEVKAVKKERFECQLIATMIWLLIHNQFFQRINNLVRKKMPADGLSLFKFFGLAKEISSILREIITHRSSPKTSWLNLIIQSVPHMFIEHKKGKRSHCQIFDELFNV